MSRRAPPSRGFTVGNVTLTRLSGPVSAYLLKPTQSFSKTMLAQGVRPPLFLLFGDTHFSTSGLCPQCKFDPNCNRKGDKGCDCCVSIDQDQLFQLLDPYSTPNHPIHVYLEWFLSKEYKQLVGKMTSDKAKDLLHYQIERLTPTHHGPLNRIYAKNYACFFPEWKDRPVFDKLFQDYCPHRNIQWHHVDMRKVVNTTNFRAYDDREDVVVIGQYLYEGLMDWILMEDPFATFRDLLWYNPAQAAVELVSGFWKYGVTHEEAASICNSLAALFTSVDAFVNDVFNEDNEVFTKRCALYKQIRKQVPRLQRMETIRVWATYILKRYIDTHYQDWFDMELEQGLSRRPKLFYAQVKDYIRIFFQTVATLLLEEDQISSKQLIEAGVWSDVLAKRPTVLSEDANPSDYVKTLLEDLGLGATCTFVDLGILLRTFKIPVNRNTGEADPTPFLSIAYFGNDHIVSLYELLVNELKMYEPVDSFIKVEGARSGGRERCLPLHHLRWNLDQAAQENGVDLSDVKPAVNKGTRRVMLSPRERLIEQAEQERVSYHRRRFSRSAKKKKKSRQRRRSV